jgi:hypothetical protein
MVGAVRCRTATYEAVARDEHATAQAAIVVVLAALAGGIGSLGSDHPGRAFVGGTIGGLVAWAALAAAATLVGTRVLATPPIRADRGQLLRVLGFAYAPYLLNVLGVVPWLGYFACFVAAPAWVAWTTFVALQAVFAIEEGRARAAALAAMVAAVTVMSLTGVAIRAAVYGEGGMD